MDSPMSWAGPLFQLTDDMAESGFYRQREIVLAWHSGYSDAAGAFPVKY